GDEFGLEDQLITGHYRTLETDVVRTDEVIQVAVAWQFFLALETEYASGLRHRFDDEHAGHDRLLREMSLKEFFVDADVLVGLDPLAKLDLHHSVDQQEGVTLRQIGFDLANIHHSSAGL